MTSLGKLTDHSVKVLTARKEKGTQRHDGKEKGGEDVFSLSTMPPGPFFFPRVIGSWGRIINFI